MWISKGNRISSTYIGTGTRFTSASKLYLWEVNVVPVHEYLQRINKEHLLMGLDRKYMTLWQLLLPLELRIPHASKNPWLLTLDLFLLACGN